MFTKNDLKTGMFGVMTNGMKFVIINGRIIYQTDGWDSVSGLNSNLSTSYRTISKVYDGCYSFHHLDRLLGGTELTHAKLVYDRERDTKPLYNGKVVCIDLCGYNARNYTVGKIYEFKDGCMTCDSGHTFGQGDTKFYCFEDWAKYTSSKFIEVKE